MRSKTTREAVPRGEAKKHSFPRRVGDNRVASITVSLLSVLFASASKNYSICRLASSQMMILEKAGRIRPPCLRLIK
jgi:hypothetical protein